MTRTIRMGETRGMNLTPHSPSRLPLLQRRRGQLALLMALLLGCTAGASAADPPLRKVELARRGKAATALVEVKEAGAYGTAFCIHSTGLFLTNEHVIRAAQEGPITLILHPGLKDEKTYAAKVLRSDRELDLALLQARDARDLAVLPLGSSDSLTELMEVVVLGFPYGKALVPDHKSYPAITVSHGHVTSLHHRQGRLHRIQVDAVLNPGNSGGPVLDEQGQVIGIVVTGVPGSGINLAIPIDDARRFALQPELHLVLPVVSRDTMHRPALFKVRVTSLVPLPRPLDLELILTGPDGKDRKHKLELDKEVYQVKAIPVPPRQGPLTFPVTAEYEKGSLHGLAADRTIKIGGKEHPLHDVRRLRLGPEPEADLVDGRRVKGTVTGLEGLVVVIGEEQIRVNLAWLAVLHCEAPPPVDAVACTVIARQDGKEIGRTGDSLVIHCNPETSPHAPGTAVGPITSPTLEGDRVVRPLASTVGGLAVGGGGRFLVLHLPRLRKLALFDVSAARVVRYIALEEKNALFAAGHDRLVIVLPHKSVIQCWSLAGGEREVSRPLPLREQAVALALGPASEGPLLVGMRSGIAFLDVRTLRPLDVHMPENRPTGMSPRTQVRASGDGKVFGVWHPDSIPQGIETYTLIGHHLLAHYEHQSAGHVIPGPDGKVIFTRRGLYTPALKARKEDNDGGAAYCIPAAQGPLYLSLTPGRPSRCALHVVGNAGPLVPLTHLELPDSLHDDDHSLAADQRIHLIPAARLIVTIPASNDRVVLHRFDLVEALKKADVDYLLVTSSPPAVAKKGRTLSYQLEVLSRQAGVTYRVESGPAGMEIGASGLLRWKVPDRTEETEVPVILAVGNRSGQEVFHTFTLAVQSLEGATDPRAERQNPGTKPPAAPSRGGERTASSTTDKNKKVRPLPGTVTDAAVGGAGRYLVLHLARERKLAVLDVIEARITRYIPVTADSIKFTAGEDKVIVVLPDTNVIQRWDLATGKRELAIPLAIKGKLQHLTLGSASHGPILVGAGENFQSHASFLDLRTLKPLPLKMPERVGVPQAPYVRASADGKVFGMWSPQVSPQGVTTLVIAGKEVRGYYRHESAGHIAPDAEGKVICTGQGLWSPEGKRLSKTPDNAYYVPAVQPGYILSVRFGDRVNPRGQSKSTLSLLLSGGEQPLATLPAGINPWDREAFGFDRHILFIPDARLIVIVPETNDKLILHRFDVVEALEQSGVDYLIVTSQPPRTARANAEYVYQVRARAKKGGLEFHLDSGPQGMTLSAEGLIKWKVPPEPKQENEVIVSVTDAAGQQSFHSFTIRIDR